MPTPPTVPDLPQDESALSLEEWQAMLWMRLGAVDRKLIVVCVLLGGILGALLLLCWTLTS